MRALRWILGLGVIVVVIAALAIAVAGLWLNTYLHSSDFKQEVEARAGQSLGGSVRIGQVDFDLWHGVKLQGIVYQLEPGHVSGPGTVQAKIAHLNCAYDWMQLLHRELRLTGVTLDEPQIVLTREPTAAPLAPPVGEPPKPAGLPAPAKIGQGKSVPFQFVLERAKIVNGAVSVRDVGGGPMVELTGVNANSTLEGGVMKGTVRIAKAVSSTGAEVNDFKAPFVYQGSSLEATPLEATAFSGNLAGGYQFSPTGSLLDLNARAVKVAEVMAALSPGSSSRLTGSLDMQSKWRNLETGTIDGEGDAQVVNGKLEGVRLLQTVSQLIRVKELEAPIVKKAQVHFVTQGGQTKLIGLQLESSFFLVTGDGVIGGNGAVQANLVLILTRDAMNKIPKEVAASFVQKPDGTGSIAFQVSGTLSNPQTDLPARMLMQNSKIQNAIQKALNKFFH